MNKIKFGTDGWRAIIGQDFTVDNVLRVSQAASGWMKQQGLTKVVIGHDTRFGGRLFCEAAATMFASEGIQVFMDEHFVTTPMVSLATRQWQAGLGVVITASHNPPGYNGYKLKSTEGGPLNEAAIQQIEANIREEVPKNLPSFASLVESGRIVFRSLHDEYLAALEQRFDMDRLRSLSSQLAYDGMYGAGMNLMKKLFPEAAHLHDIPNPGFGGTPPEPIARNLGLLMQRIKENDSLRVGLAHDGDGDRIGLVDGNGNYIDSHHVLLLLLYYLAEHKHQKGKVVVSFATSEKVRKLAESYGLEFEYTRIGFKHIAPIMLREPVILAGEEAGGIGCIGHIPERDGIWIGLILLELLEQTGQDITSLIQMLHERLGPFVYDRFDLTLTEDQKTSIITRCEKGEITRLGGRNIRNTYNLDGYKYYFDPDSWLMIRPSGTEPVLRLYAQAGSKEELDKMMESARRELLA